MKTWIKEKALKITNGYKNPLTGEIMSSDIYVHFKTFACKLDECNKFNSFNELIVSNLKK